MQERIRRRQSDRRYELEMEEAVAMACKSNRRPTLPTTTRKIQDGPAGAVNPPHMGVTGSRIRCVGFDSQMPTTGELDGPGTS